MDWTRIDTWPNARLSRRISGPIHRWHVQEAGDGDLILLLHGAGGSTHSFRDLIPKLSPTHRIVALDLPGHGFTQLGARLRSGLDHMTQDIAALCIQEGWAPTAIVGHSAGAALGLSLAQQVLSPRGHTPTVIGINAALEQFKGIAGLLFPIMAKMLAALPLTAMLFSGSSENPERVRSLIASTGSTLTEEGIDLYRQLVTDRDHVDGALKMMAQWNLDSLLRNLPSVPAGTHLIIGTKDGTVPPDTSRDAAKRMRSARVIELDGLGHLAHEEDPDAVAAIILDALAQPSIPHTRA